jgi:hypothetical protein
MNLFLILLNKLHIFVQKHVNLKCKYSVVAKMLLYSNQTSLSKNTIMIGHLFVLSTANTSYRNRYFNKDHYLLAIFCLLSLMLFIIMESA